MSHRTHSIDSLADPNVSMFPNSRNTTITGGEFTTVQGNYTKNIYLPSDSTKEQIQPLPSLRPPRRLFTGRDTYLQALQDHFSPKRANGRKMFLLHGMGGIGKTQICLKFLEKHEKWFSDIFWIDASSEHTIELCLRQVAQEHKVHSTPSAESALRWISKQHSWLMLFDNADGGYQVVEKFIPSGTGGNILITSRNRALARVTSGKNSLEVTEMGKEEANALLLKSSMVDDDSEDVATVAGKLVTALGCIPLAIDQAGAYVQSCGCGLDYYLELFNKHHAKLMSDKEFTGASSYNQCTYGTWEISIEEIKHRAEGDESNGQNVAAQSALNLHNIFAFLHHDNISAEIFKNAALNLMKRKNAITNDLPQSITLLDSKTVFLNDDGDWDAFQFQAGIKVLLSFSLIREHGKMYSVHPLIQTWSRDRIPVASISECCQKSRSLLACSLKLDYYEDNHRFCTVLAPHIKRNGEYAAQMSSGSQYYDDQNETFEFIFFRAGDWNEAESLQVQVMEVRMEKLGPLHPDTLRAMGNLAITYRNQGKWNEAESLQVQVMETSKEELGPLHPDTLRAMGNLAITYRNQGKWNEAETLQVQVMEASKQKLEPLHPDTLSAMGNLAGTYSNQGKWNEAESLQVQVMEARKEKLGPLHPHTLTAMHSVALTYSNQGKWNEAESLQVQVMEASKERLGPLHLHTLAAMHCLALTYNNQGKWNEAESLQVQVMEASKERLGSLHLHTLAAMHCLALTYNNQGKWNEAESLQVQVIEASKERFGPLHPDTLTAVGNMALTYSNQGKWNEAESLQVQVMEARKERLGPLHPDTLTAMGNMAYIYKGQNKVKEAEELLGSSIKGMQQVLGVEHPTTIHYMQFSLQ
ncbi:hypothetical protein JOM56_001130 [Amanita muscaria]